MQRSRLAFVVSIIAAVSSVASIATAQWGTPIDIGPAPGAAWARKWGDVNGDLVPDLLTATNSGTAVRVQLVSGGALLPPVDYPTTGALQSLAIADVDGDGDSDVAVATTSPFGVDVLLGDGIGGFAAPIHVATLNDHYSAGIDAADLDGDGLADIVVTLGLAYVYPSYAWTNKVAVLRSAGAGAWSAPQYFIVGLGPQPLVIADLDMDGDRDFVTGNSASFSIGLNIGAAAFTVTTTNTTSQVMELAYTDVDLDAVSDLVLALANAAEFRRGLGGAAFAPPTSYVSGASPNRGLVCTDLDGDGLKDLVVSSNAQYYATFWRGQPGGSFGLGSLFPAGGTGTVAAFDHDGDGRLDLAFGGRFVVHNDAGFCPVYAYCTPKLSATTGCASAVTYSGQPRVGASSGFTIRALQVQSQVSGLFFYGINGPSSAPFAGGSMCVAPPRVRTALQNSGGPLPSGADCTGTLSIDFNAYVASGAGPAAIHVAGTAIHGQFWHRDVGGSTATSDALRFEMFP